MVSIITFGLSSQKCFVCFCLVQDVLTSRWDLNIQLINGEHYLQLNLPINMVSSVSVYSRSYLHTVPLIIIYI